MAGQAGLEPATTGFGVRRSSQLELLTPTSPLPLQFDFPVRGVGPAKRAELLKSQLFRGGLFVFRRGIVFTLAPITSKANLISHNVFLWPSLRYSIILVTTPAPTVLPPSRMANLRPSSMATLVMRSTSIFTLSPGMIISVPSGNFVTPVTSVVRI